MTPQFLVLLGTILAVGAAATPEAKAEIGTLLALISGVMFGLAIGSKWLW